MRRPNEDIRELVKNKGLTFWQVATELNMWNSNLTRLLYRPLTAEKKTVILEAIEKLVAQKECINR